MAEMRTNDQHRPIPSQQRRASGPVSLPSSSSSSPSSPTLPLPITRSGTGAGPNHNLSHKGTATAEAFHATADEQEAYELSLLSSSPTFYALEIAQADGHTAAADEMSVPLGHGAVDAAAVTAAHEAGEAHGAAKMIRSASSNTHAPRDASVLSSTRPQSVRSASSADDVPLTSGGGGGGTSTTSPLSTPGEGHALHTTQPLSNVDPYVALRHQAMPHPPRTPPSRQQTSSNQTDATYVPLAMTSPASLASSMSRSPVASMHLPLDSSPYDAFRSTPPDAYPPAIYGMIGPWLASSSTPQSPTFAPMHSHMSSTDSSVYMPGYNAMFLNMGGMMPRPPPGPGLVTNGHGPPTFSMPQPHGLQPQSSPSQHEQHQPQQHQPPHFTSPAQHHDHTAQNGLMGMGEARHGRRGSHLSQGALPLSGPPQYGHNPWGGLSHSIVQNGYLPGIPMQAGGWSPIDALNGGAGMHRRIVSGPYSSPVLPPMAYAHQQPGSPNAFGRTASGGGSPGGSNGFGRGMHSRTPSSLSFVSSSYGRMTTPSEQSSRSALLEEFRARHNRGRRFELNDIRGSVVEFSGDQHGSRFTQEKLGTATEAERAMVFDEVLSHALSLTTDVFGNYVVQKLLEHGTDEMRRQLVQQMTGHVLPLSLSTYGCRVVQRALDVIDQASRLQMADELREQVLQCVRDQNANHVVQKVLERVSPTSKVDYIPQTFRGNVFNLAAHCYSCRVLQRIFEHCDVDQTRPLMDELLANTERLMHDQYGNYVVQWVLRNAEQADKDSVIELAKGNVLRLSCHKFASNVVEQIIAAASGNVVDELIEEIVSTPTSIGDAKDGVADEANVTATVMMRDQYGNYVLQRFLERADARQKQRLVAVIRPMLHSVKRSAVGYTKHLAAIERLLDSSNVVQRNNAVTLTGRGGGGGGGGGGAKNQ